jgi:hypothetical protein
MARVSAVAAFPTAIEFFILRIKAEPHSAYTQYQWNDNITNYLLSG